MFQMNEVLDRKDLFCNDCLENLKRLSGRANTEKHQVRSLVVFMSGIYAFWVIGIVTLVRISVS